MLMTISEYPLTFLEISLFIGNEYRLSVGDLAGARSPINLGALAPWSRAQCAQWERCVRLLVISTIILFKSATKCKHF